MSFHASFEMPLADPLDQSLPGRLSLQGLSHQQNIPAYQQNLQQSLLQSLQQSSPPGLQANHPPGLQANHQPNHQNTLQNGLHNSLQNGLHNSLQNILGLQTILGQNAPHTLSSSYSEWIPPPALVTTNSDGIDLNDEVFFNYNSGYTHDADISDAHYDAGPGPALNATVGLPRDRAAFLDDFAQLDPPARLHKLATAPTDSFNALLLALLLTAYALQLAITTPDLLLALPLKSDANYSHLRRFSVAVEQLNRMTLHNATLELPTPDVYLLVDAREEERTINPRQLLGGAPHLGGVFASSSRYVLPSLVLLPSLSTFFARPDLGLVPDLALEQPAPANALAFPEMGASNPYVMNDECVSAITYWLNNTADVIDKTDGIARNPTGVTKPAGWKRRNLIQVLPTSGDTSPQRILPGQKRKRRKSVTTAIAEMLPAEQAALPQREVLHDDADADRMPQTLDYLQPMKEVDVEGHVLVPRSAEDDEPKPFPCSECDKQFKRLEHLKRHVRSVHSSIRPFHCKYCEKKFSRLDNLAQHSKTHFKINANGTTTVIYGNPNPHNRGGRKKSISSDTSVAS